jgi:hypothetical protein
MDAWWAEFQCTQLGTDPHEVVSLQNLDAYIARALEPAARAGDAASSNDRIMFA